MKTKVAVVILNWNGRALLERFLPSVVAHSADEGVEIIVADNCSDDGSLSFLKDNYPQVRTIVLSQNWGYADGYNKALQEIEAEYYVLLNSDVEVTFGWLQPMIDYMDEHPVVAAIQPKILSERNKTYFEYAGASGGFIDKYGYPFCRGRIFGVVEEDGGQYNSVSDIFWASGAALLIRSKDYFEVGGFDGTFFAHMEEIDLCWRLNARGRRIVCFPQSVVYHVGGATLTGESPRKTYLNFRNNIIMLYKNLQEQDFEKLYSIRRMFDYAAALKYFLGGKKKNAKAIFEAHQDFKRIKSDYKQQQKENQKYAIQPQIGTIYKSSILWDFYLKGIKKFGDLNI